MAGLLGRHVSAGEQIRWNHQHICYHINAHHHLDQHHHQHYKHHQIVSLMMIDCHQNFAVFSQQLCSKQVQLDLEEVCCSPASSDSNIFEVKIYFEIYLRNSHKSNYLDSGFDLEIFQEDF